MRCPVPFPAKLAAELGAVGWLGWRAGSCQVVPGANFVQECNKPQPVLVVHVPSVLQKPLRLTSSLVWAASLAQLSARGLERKPDHATPYHKAFNPTLEEYFSPGLEQKLPLGVTCSSFFGCRESSANTFPVLLRAAQNQGG